MHPEKQCVMHPEKQCIMHPEKQCVMHPEKPSIQKPVKLVINICVLTNCVKTTALKIHQFVQTNNPSYHVYSISNIESSRQTLFMAVNV